MNWIEKVREKLNVIQRVCDYPLTLAADKSIWEVLTMIRLASNEALAAIPDEPEMMKLLRWLDENREAAERGARYGLSIGLSTTAQCAKDTIEHIEREFGYKLEDEDNVE